MAVLRGHFVLIILAGLAAPEGRGDVSSGARAVRQIPPDKSLSRRRNEKNPKS